MYRMTPESGSTVLRATPGATAAGAANTRSPFVRLRELLADTPPGQSPISLAVGEPQHPIPPFVGAVIAAHVGEFGRYPMNRGLDEFGVAVGQWLDRRYKLPRRVDPAAEVLVLNGPNLGRLGSREPEVYGTATLQDLAEACVAAGRELDLHVEVRQTDDEAELIGWIHEAADRQLPVVLNPAAFTHYSYALRDALAMRTAPLVEVHLSNPAARETFRHTSVVSAVADGTIAGFGPRSYGLALRAVSGLLDR